MAKLIDSEEKKALCKKMAVNLPALRAKAGLSQEELSERLGFSRQTISAIENEKRDMQWSTFVAIALFFLKDCELRELMIVMGVVSEAVESNLAL